MVLSLPVRSFPALRGTPNPRRVGAWSTALALHALLLGVLLLPRLPLELPAPPPPSEPFVVEEIVAPEPVPVVLVPEPPLPQPTLAEQPTVEVVPAVPPLVFDRTALPVPAPEVVLAPVYAAAHDAAAGAVGSSQAIAIDSVTPPPYPPRAARRGLEGVVVLRVLIGADGRPVQVEVEHGSGHRELDRAASEHVLDAWRFHPALRDGVPVRAWARVPIAFSLQR